MNIHEYQAKDLLQEYGVPVPRGYAAYTSSEVDTALSQLNDDDLIVVKAQIHAGGRGKGGGVKLAKNLDEVKEKAEAIIGMQLVTPQTIISEGATISAPACACAKMSKDRVF